MDTQTLIQILSIVGSFMGSALIAWKLPKYYIDKEAVEPVRELKETIRVQQKEIDLLKDEINAFKVSQARDTEILKSVHEKIEKVADQLTELSKAFWNRK